MAPTPSAFVLLGLVLLAGPGRGNEGGAAGSCRCQRIRAPPRFLDRLRSCDACGEFTRFNFPNRRLCALKGEEWVEELENSFCRQGHPGEGAGGADASRGDGLPAPTSSGTAPALTSPTTASPTSAGVSLDKRREMAWVAETPMDGARSSAEPNAEAAAREASRAPSKEEEKSAPPQAADAKIFILLPFVAMMGFVTFVVCRKQRGPQGGRRADPRPPAPPGEGEGVFCLPGEET